MFSSLLQGLKLELHANSLIRIFERLEDFRVERSKLHKLIDIIFITLSATLCGYDGCE